jgi:hypothetical protein
MLARTKPSRSAARTRAYRRRLAEGLAVYRVEVSGNVFDMLCQYGWLDEAAALDPKLVSSAISAFLQAAAENQ